MTPPPCPPRIAQDIGGTNYPAYFKAFYEHDATITRDHWLSGVRREGNRLIATLRNEYTKSTVERVVDQVVTEHGTTPMDEIYFSLKEGSVNHGEIDLAALAAGESQAVVRNPDGAYRLFRIGDAVASRNIHGAIFDALRLCKDF